MSSKNSKRRQYADRELARSVERVVAGGEKAAAVSREANIPYRTLAKYVRRARAGESLTRRRTGPPPMLAADGERRLLEWMRALQRQGLPVRRRELIAKANGLLQESSVANEQLSAGWYKRFRERHPEVTGSSANMAVNGDSALGAEAATSSGTSGADDSDQPAVVDGETPSSSGDAEVPAAAKDPVASDHQVAVSALTPQQMANLSPTERAVLVLQDQYAGKMAACDVVEAFDVMLDPMKARVFLVMSAGAGRDLWLRNQVAKARE